MNLRSNIIAGVILAGVGLAVLGGTGPRSNGAAEPEWAGRVVRVGELRVQLMGVRSEASYDGIGDALQSVLTIQCDVICPAESEGIAVRPNLDVTVLEDEHGNDLLVGLTPRDPTTLGYRDHPFAKSYRQRDVAAVDPNRSLVFRKTCYFVAIDPRYQPRRLRRVVGEAEVLLPRGVQTFDFDAVPGDIESRTLRELVPGLWMAVSREMVRGGSITSIYCWQCNRVRAGFEGEPEWATLSQCEAAPPRHRRQAVAADAIGNDPSKSPAVIGIWEIDEEGKPVMPATFDLSVLEKRESGVYSWRRYDDSIRTGTTPRRVRVAVATELERTQVPFEFRDVPLARELPGE